jgi:hypothetical protein
MLFLDELVSERGSEAVGGERNCREPFESHPINLALVWPVLGQELPYEILRYICRQILQVDSACSDRGSHTEQEPILQLALAIFRKIVAKVGHWQVEK